jgi:hypothetical protein
MRHEVTGYEPLGAILDEAYNQSALGKGKARHSRGGTPFLRQPICEIGRMVGPGFNGGQAMKKLQEAAGMVNRGEFTAAEQELLGVIVYTAAAIIILREMAGKDDAKVNLTKDIQVNTQKSGAPWPPS